MERARGRTQTLSRSGLDLHSEFRIQNYAGSGSSQPAGRRIRGEADRSAAGVGWRDLSGPVSRPPRGRRISCTPMVAFLTAAGLSWIVPAAAQSPPTAAASVASADVSPTISLHLDAPPPPIAPDVIRRDTEGRATVRAVRVSQPMRIDGALDEALYRDVP